MTPERQQEAHSIYRSSTSSPSWDVSLEKCVSPRWAGFLREILQSIGRRPNKQLVLVRVVRVNQVNATFFGVRTAGVRRMHKQYIYMYRSVTLHAVQVANFVRIVLPYLRCCSETATGFTPTSPSNAMHKQQHDSTTTPSSRCIPHTDRVRKRGK